MTKLPQGWEVKKLGDIVEIQIGKTPSRNNIDFFQGKNIWLSIRDLKSKFVSSSNEKISNDAILKTNMKIVPKGTLLMSFKLTLGKTAFADCDLYTNEAIAAIFIKDKNINKYFLDYALKFADLEKYVDNAVKGKTLNKQKLKQIEILLPSLKEQERIVGILDESFAKIDESIKILEQDLLNLDELMQSALQKAFNPLKDNAKENYKLPQGWEKFNFDNIFYSPSSKNYQLNTKDYLEKGCIPIIDQSKKFIIGYSNNYEKVFKINNCNNSCIIFGDHTRVLKFIDFDFIVGADGVKILLNKDIERFNTKFLFFQLLYKDIPLLGYRRHFSVLKQNTFSIPPLKEQEQIASYLDELSSNVKNLKQNYQAQIKDLQELKKSLLDKAFKGRL
ncbi:restriction endonuclease subunit S [Campylobacter lari]|uniref:restriction endonuclease subunit S n=1 Tax=Campylobacter lari TaxID=201 RepID=UPI00144F2B8E|nr:restriction endonuclease subunit S [Campylobacter lari]MBT0759761.1 restriction endonuclease subunit S [Campylobacter lari]